MRFRTKMFLAWVGLAVALWGGMFWAIRHSVDRSFHRMADDTFAGIHRGLLQLYLDRVSSMRQACQLVINIPELRALIAEQNYELSTENQTSLSERLEYVNGVVGTTFVLALNSAKQPVAQNPGSAWPNITELGDFLRDSPASSSLVQRTFAGSSDGQHGLWSYHGRLYQVAAVPLVFQPDSAKAARPDGALIMGRQLTDSYSRTLGESYDCEITFLADGAVAASSLPLDIHPDLAAAYGQAYDVRAWDASADGTLPTSVELGTKSYRTAPESLIDPCSGQRVGTVLIQQDQAAVQDFLWGMGRDLFLTMLAGVLLAAPAGYVLSLAITRPVQALAEGVRDVARGDLNVTFKSPGKDELGQLAAAFNHMVGRLRQSRDELERLLEEARRGAQREHLLHEVAQQISQRLDVNSSTTMFANSVHKLLPDVQLGIFSYDSATKDLRVLDASHGAVNASIGGSERAPQETSSGIAQLPALRDPAAIAQLGRHQLIYVPDWRPDIGKERLGSAALTSSTCVVPMRTEQRLIGALSATRSRRDAFSDEEREFLQALADHFAIALANAQVHEELQRAYEDLRANQRQIIQTERLRALGQMASGIAHDFNNHLTGVLAFLEMALDHENLDGEIREWLSMSRESTLAAADVVTLLRSFYRRESNDALEPVDLNRLVSSTISLTKPRWFDMPRQHGIAIEVAEDLSDVGCALGNMAELRDALTNLLFNAVDAMPHDGVITVRTRRASDEIVLEVQDTGAGMTDEVRERCLEPFFTTKGVKGTGLGLSMVHGIVERNRGRMTIETQLNVGTKISVFLQPSAQNVADADTPEEMQLSEHRKVLCVDDDRRILASLDGMLRQLGHEVVTTDSGADALSLLASSEFDVLITDLGMPGVDGREVARTAKRHSPRMLVLLLTGWADRLSIEGAAVEGVDEVLGKPITKVRLQQAVLGSQHTSNAGPAHPMAGAPS